MSEPRSFPFIIMAESTSKMDAWNKFRDELEHNLIYIQGNKYWRTVPRIEEVGDFFSGETIYRVSARIFSVINPMDGLEVLDISKPYPTTTGFEEIETTIGIEGFKS